MIRCASCGAAHPPNTLFCDECGFRLTAAPISTPPVPAQTQASSRAEPTLPAGSGHQARSAAVPTTESRLPAGSGPQARSAAVQATESRLPESSGAQPLVVKLATRDAETRYECALQTELLIGRGDHGGKRPDIDLTGPRGIEHGVSRRHARIVRSGDDAALEDLGSLNGTFIGGRRLTPGRPEVIRPGDELQFGKLLLVVGR